MILKLKASIAPGVLRMEQHQAPLILAALHLSDPINMVIDAPGAAPLTERRQRPASGLGALPGQR